MKLPNGERAVVSDEKLYGFLVNPDHPAQPGHAELFDRLLGIDSDSAERLRDALLTAARESEAAPGSPSPHGQKFEVRFSMAGRRGTYIILSVWIIERGADAPRLVTAFVE